MPNFFQNMVGAVGNAFSEAGLAGPVAGKLTDRRVISLCAAASTDVYNDQSSYCTHAIKRIDFGKFNGTIQWALYQTDKGTIMAFMGTDPSKSQQLAQDMSAAIGNTGAITHAIAAARDVARRMRPNYVTGHSLGGLLAECVTSYEGIPGCNFGAPGPWGSFGNSATTLSGNNFNGVPFRVIMNEHDVIGRAIGGIAGSQSSHINKSSDLWWVNFQPVTTTLGHSCEAYCDTVGRP